MRGTGYVEALLGRGARLDLPIAAALGRVGEFQRLLSGADGAARHLAFALAAQYGRVEIVRMLLDAGEDPDRFHPVWGHSPTTALHQAAGEGYMELAQLLIERGARLDIRDVLWGGTPEGWARHAGRTELADFLRDSERGDCASGE